MLLQITRRRHLADRILHSRLALFRTQQREVPKIFDSVADSMQPDRCDRPVGSSERQLPVSDIVRVALPRRPVLRIDVR